MESNSDGFMLDSPVGTVVAAAFVGDRKSEHVINWMLANFSPENNIVFKLLHVRPRTKLVPTPMGNLIPISQVRENVAEAYRKEMEWLASAKITPYEKIFLRKKVPVNVVLIESDDAPSAIAEEVKTSFISKLVIEASSTSLFSRKLNLSSRISECIPSSCTVYAISNGKLQSLRPSDSDRISSMNCIDSSGNSFSPTNSTSMNSTILTAVSTAASFHMPSYSLPAQNLQDLALVRESHLFHQGSLSYGVRDQYLDAEEIEEVGISCPVNSEIGSQIDSSFSFTLDTATADSHEASSSKCQEYVDLELEKLKTELRHVRGIFATAQTETIEASRKIDELNILRLGKAEKLKELKKGEERALQIARDEKEKSEAANRAAEATMGLAEQEAAVRKYVEERAISDAEETAKLENAVTGNVQNYQTFTWEELSTATSSFSKEHEIGSGANGTVYKCTLRHTTAAVKVLHSNNTRGIHQFRKELEILSRIHHPHLLMLLGACPERTCLVYEYMKNGNLEDRLKCKSNSPPIHWADRFRLAWEIASALVFLHSTKPDPIIHCDLKPANILLDSNLVSKIGDFGLSTILNPDIVLSAITSDIGLIGTLCFIDPEYQRTGIISPMSDVYAFGMVILQLLTGRQAMALAHIVEAAVTDEKLTDILDSQAGCWPLEQTKELALLGLNCVEIRRKDRPDLKEEVLPKLLKLKQAAQTQAQQCTHTLSAQPPPHFICPILKEVMEEPHVAADGYTYDLKAIKKRLERTDKSPITGQPLQHKHLVPNYTLLSAILKWQSSRS